MPPEKMLAFAGDPCHCGKHIKERLIVLVGSHRLGSEKLPLLVTGKSKHPRCFEGSVPQPVLYEANKKAWVTQQLFEAHVRKRCRRFKQQNRRVLLFVDNFAAHSHIKDLKAIQSEFRSPNTTAILQPMNRGGIRNMKEYYKSHVFSRMVLCSDSGKSYAVNLRSPVSMIAKSWKAVTQGTLLNFCRHADFTLDSEMAVSLQVDSVCDELPFTDVAFDNLRATGVSVPAEITF
nr:tigger transposable element-derived protein 4-like [Rhipicephalus microplus]